MDMWGNMLRVLKVYTGEMVLGKEMQNEEDCWSFVMRESCACQILGLKRQTKGKSLIVPVDVEQKLILCLWGNVLFVLFYLPHLSSIHEKANCIAILWTGSPHSLGSCLFRVFMGHLSST